MTSDFEELSVIQLLESQLQTASEHAEGLEMPTETKKVNSVVLSFVSPVMSDKSEH